LSLSDLTIQKLKSDKNQIFWDTNLPAFGIRVGKLKKTFVYRGQVDSQCRVTIGNFDYK
jgi:hypothetical protein